MAKKETRTLPRIRYANVNIYVEEAVNIWNHRPAIVVVWKKRKQALMRIIPSRQWRDDNIEENLGGLFSHEILHIWLGKVFGLRITMKLDKLPKPNNWEEFMTGVFGWGLGGDKQSKSA